MVTSLAGGHERADYDGVEQVGTSGPGPRRQAMVGMMRVPPGEAHGKVVG